MKSIIILAALVLSLSLSTSFSESTKSHLSKKSYSEAKSEVLGQREKFKQLYNAATPAEKKTILAKAGGYLDSAVCEVLFPYWKGTKWDFNGHTNVPKEGEIACGYLVSTLLKHAGVNLNRYKMAQQSSLSEIKTVSGVSGAKFIGDNSTTAVEKIKELDNGLYILGLSNHVGFIRVRDKRVDFIHSTYLSPTEAINEKAELSEAFAYSNVYYIGDISNSENLVKKWITNEVVSIVFD